MRKLKLYHMGFTMVELLVVISVIGLLAVAVLVAINPLRQIQKGRDAARIQALAQMQQAIEAYIITHRRAPVNQTPGTYYWSSQPNFLQELITSGNLRNIPSAPGGGIGFGYYDYGRGNTVGALLVVTLEAIDATVIPPEGSCRPFPNNNWCSSINASKYYCLCTPY